MTNKVLIVALLLSLVCAAKTHRSSSARAKFRRTHPCPSTGLTTGSCPNFIIDHVIPLCANGADDPSNMQWQTVADAKAKDKLERQQCRLERSKAH